ncbi:MAG: YcxB family protein [Mesorhizobium sp.]
MMIREYTVDVSADEASRMSNVLGADGAGAVRPGLKTFRFDQDAFVAVADGGFERFLWAAFDRVVESDGMIYLAKGAAVKFCLPVAGLRDADIRRAIWDFVSDHVGLNA